MFRAIAASSRGRRLFVLGLITAVSATMFTSDFAEAKRKRGGKRTHVARVAYAPPFSTIVVDANSGATLQANNADAQRFPASLTKVMTLYLLFEQIESGRMKLDTMMPVSEHAAVQAPTKLGLREGEQLKVEDAIKGLVTRSANDAAVVIAEAVAGSEEEFARQMTRKARALGMNRTTYRNANGLPDEDQVTTARDQALLGRAIQDRFPRYYRYFATNSFYYRGKAIRNHNKLLGRVEGVDGIKTGFTRASGFNLVTSIKRGNRYLVAVVLGGRSGGSRDSIMRNLIAENLERGATKRTVAAITENGPSATAVAQPSGTSARSEIRSADRKTVELKPNAASDFDGEGNPARRDFAPVQVAAAGSAEPIAATTPATRQQRMAPLTNGVVAAQALAPIPGSTEPMTPVRVRTLQVKAGTLKVASAGATQIVPQPSPSQVASAVEPPQSNAVAKSDLAPLAPHHGKGQGILGTLPASAMAYAEPAARAGTTVAAVAAAPAQSQIDAHKPSIRPGSWIIQVGALESEAEAKSRLSEARDHARTILGKAEPFTEAVAKGDKQFYRARFAGFVDKDKAEAACKTLKRSDLPCFAMKY
ncbi:serine hydrolase [Bradyrhizobium sp. LHD-71]|uniref:serine hydrolase n=1 Tax=Bradyrhizobium sp. LHD-71 TaxID=3072141 RepID=UPI00280FB99A|nr:serine hydrolase [Bradyrhizobium sp. LHD-71]MDQ8726309.1 SPOR domain-containing protein [Bradyrhizobium sp. LHD-71]